MGILSLFSFKKAQTAEELAVQAVKEGWRPPTTALDAAKGPPPAAAAVYPPPAAETAMDEDDVEMTEDGPNYAAALSLTADQYAALSTEEQNEYALWWAQCNGLAPAA